MYEGKASKHHLRDIKRQAQRNATNTAAHHKLCRVQHIP
jgi:hypothetical protein